MPIIKTKVGDVNLEIAKNLYEKGGAEKVYEYANKFGDMFPYSPCKPCEADTPTVETLDYKVCMVCGEEKAHNLFKIDGYRKDDKNEFTGYIGELFDELRIEADESCEQCDSMPCQCANIYAPNAG